MNIIDVVVIGQNYSTSLGLIQATGEAGFSCGLVKSVVNVPKALTPDLASNYVVRYVICHRHRDQECMKALIEEFSSKEKRLVLLPSDDYSVALIDRNREQLAKHFYLPQIAGGAGSLVHNMDKFHQGKIALSVGLQTANNWTIKAGSTTLPDDIIFPCITKPQVSIGSPKSYIKKCVSAEELRTVLEEIGSNKPCDVLIEEFVEVRQEFTVPGVSINGEVIIPAFIKKTLIGKGIHRGVTISGKVLSTSHFPKRIIDTLKSFVVEMAYEGIFDIELFLTDNGFYFNEMNLRYGAAGYSLTRAGINLPALYVRSCANQQSVLPNSLQRDGLTFVSDKAALDYLISRHIGYRTYRKLVGEADFRFLVDNKDKGARNAFKKIERKVVISNIIKGNI